MTDFLSNLLQRSGSSAVPASAAIFRPRLPALFEATDGTEAISAPRPAPVHADGFSPPEGSSASRSDTLPNVLPPPIAKPASALAHVDEDRPASLPLVVPRPGPTMERMFPSLHDLQTDPPHQSTRPAKKTQAADAAIASESTIGVASRPAVNGRRKSARDDGASGPIPVKAVRETAGDSQPGPAASPPAAPPAELPGANEPVVQIHIGRIEVRAVTPPASPSVSPPASTGPTLSLDEYLRQREGRR